MALLSGRRYESFETAAAWTAFATKWRATLPRMRAEFEARVLSHAWTRPLPRIAGLDAAAQVEAEDANVRACVTHAREIPELEAD